MSVITREDPTPKNQINDIRIVVSFRHLVNGSLFGDAQQDVEHYSAPPIRGHGRHPTTQ
jgi:hypothetical protein